MASSYTDATSYRSIQVTVSGSTLTSVQGTRHTSVNITTDDSTLGNSNTASTYDTFTVNTQNFGTLDYIGTATLNGISGFLAKDLSSGNYYFFTSNQSLGNGYFSGSYTADTTGTANTWNLATDSANCFCAGTCIATPTGEVAVETLKADDLVLTADGVAAPVRWLGRQVVSTLFADPLRVAPIRIRAGALGGGLPRRDLCVSPGHAVLVDGVLAQAEALVNGVSILREAEVPENFVYYHIECAEHVLVLAEGTPAESFLDNIAHARFENQAEREALTSPAPKAELPLPRAQSVRQLPRGTRARLAALAGELYGQTIIAA